MSWWRPELRVLFVCTANVCRSPLAEAMLRRRLQVLGLGRRVQVRSAGTRVAQPGRPPDPRVLKLAQEAGFSLGRIRARQLTASILLRQDFVLAMEPDHLDQIAALVAGVGLTANTQLLGDCLSGSPGVSLAIPDPYYSGMQGFIEVFDQIDLALCSLIPQLQQRLQA